MASKGKRQAPRKSPKEETAIGPIELVVRRGALRRFAALKEKTAELPVKVTWDRRQRERRSTARHAGPERRKIDRRHPPPFTWELADFVVVGQALQPASRAVAHNANKKAAGIKNKRPKGANRKRKAAN